MAKSERIPVVQLQSCKLIGYHLIDVRSPGEFDEFHIDGATNLPIFSNEERANVGTIYKQIGKQEAKELGLSIVSPKLPTMVNKLKQIEQDQNKPILIYCARGGMRSESIVSIMNFMGMTCFQLEGGIRAYRKAIMKQLEWAAADPKPFIVLEGLTGTRKTDFLEVLQEEGYPVLNLEQMAGHRGSIFGKIGLVNQSQKEFERNLADRLLELEHSDYYIIESESKRIGQVIVPEWILHGKENGHRIHIHSPFEQRVKVICDTYQPERFHEEIGKALIRLTKRLKNPTVAAKVNNSFENRDYHAVVRQLLLHYYDPKYTHAAKKYKSSTTNLSIETFSQGIQQIKIAIEQVKKNAVFFSD